MPVEKKKPKKEPVKPKKKAPAQKQKQKQSQTVVIHLGGAKTAKPKKTSSKSAASIPHIYAPQQPTQQFDYMRIADILKAANSVPVFSQPRNIPQPTPVSTPIAELPEEIAQPVKTTIRVPKPQVPKPQPDDSRTESTVPIASGIPRMPGLKRNDSVVSSITFSDAGPDQVMEQIDSTIAEMEARRKLAKRRAEKEASNMKETLSDI